MICPRCSSHAIVKKRDRHVAKELWAYLPPVYRQCAMTYTDYWEAYQQVFPIKRHQAVGKETGLTNHIERFNCTARQRIGWAFSSKVPYNF
jgi:IS1 family transposase